MKQIALKMSKSNIKIFVLEDSIERIKWFKNRFKDYSIDFASSYIDAYEQIKKNSYSVIFLDHDLGVGYGTGSDLTNKMKEESLCKECRIIIHSTNPVANKIMQQDLSYCDIPVVCIPFVHLVSLNLNSRFLKI